ncbi:MAG: cyclic nucleotide-binding domain-containing protein [Gammaproteobacteria bacterium]|nr:cyclic nucleotide-binding domain-containing protein [Gammaproteobacteria bacterium]
MSESIDLISKKALVKSQVCFSLLTEAELDTLTNMFIEKQVSPGTTLVKEGDPVDSVYIIVHGTADVTHAVIKDNQIQYEFLATLHDKSAIGLSETGFYSLSGVRTATVIATSEMTLLRLSVAAFNGFALANSHVSEVMRTYADRE